MAITNLDQLKRGTPWGFGGGGEMKAIGSAFGGLKPGQIYIKDGKIWLRGQGGTARSLTGAQLQKLDPTAMADPQVKSIVNQQSSIDRANSILGGGSSGAGGGLGGTLQDLIKSYREQSDRARTETLKRYNEGRGILDKRFSRNMSRVDNIGAATKANIEQSAEKAVANMRQSARRRGIGGVMAAFGGGERRRRDQSLSEHAERMALMKTGLDANLSKDIYDHVASRNDIGPDPALLSSLSALAGRGSVGGQPRVTTSVYRPRVTRPASSSLVTETRRFPTGTQPATAQATTAPVQSQPVSKPKVSRKNPGSGWGYAQGPLSTLSIGKNGIEMGLPTTQAPSSAPTAGTGNLMLEEARTPESVSRNAAIQMKNMEALRKKRMLSYARSMAKFNEPIDYMAQYKRAGTW